LSPAVEYGHPAAFSDRNVMAAFVHTAGNAFGAGPDNAAVDFPLGRSLRIGLRAIGRDIPDAPAFGSKLARREPLANKLRKIAGGDG
jgi:hypothetical protein